MLSGFSSSMEQQGVSGVPSANQQDGSRQSASTAHQQTDPSVTLETLKAIMKRVAVEAIEESQRRTPASSLPPTTRRVSLSCTCAASGPPRGGKWSMGVIPCNI